MKRITLAFDSFKGSFSSLEVAASFAEALRRHVGHCHIDMVEIADGGEGMTPPIVRACDGEWVECMASDPLGRTIECRYGIIDEGRTAVIELATASGLTLLTPDERNPMLTTTYGTGELIADALRRGCRKVLLGIGGSATNDGGVGLLRALGFRFRDSAGCEVKGSGEELMRIATIDDSRAMEALHLVDFVVACDVDNPLYGASGAAYVYAPQKGADKVMVAMLDEGLRNYGSRLMDYCGYDVSQLAGSGAAGGVGAAMVAVLGSRLQRGIEVVLDAIAFEHTIADSDLVVTGEGRIDSQTLHGKAPRGILDMAAQRGIPVVAVGGSVVWSDELRSCGFSDIVALTDGSIPVEEAMRPEVTKRNLERVAEYVAQKFLA